MSKYEERLSVSEQNYTHAAVLFVHDKMNTRRVRNIKDIKNKYEGSSKNHIKPKHKNNFNGQHTYHAWTRCPDNCQSKHNDHFRYRRARIVGLGVSHEEAKRCGARARSRRMSRKLCSYSPELRAGDFNSKRRKASDCSLLASGGRSRAPSMMSQTSGKGFASKKPRYEVSRQQLNDNEDSKPSADECKENVKKNAPAAKNGPVIKKVNVLDEETRKMVFSHAVVEFDCLNVPLIREIMFVREDLDGKGAKQIMPRHRHDFDNN